MKNYLIRTLSLVCLIGLACSAVSGQPFDPKMKFIYKKGWIDLNKNGKKDIYEDPAQPVELRVKDLLSQMTLDEKTCQMATLYGFRRVLKDSLPTPEWKNMIWKDGIANIDEHLNGFISWGGPVGDYDIVRNITKHVWAMNKTQAFFIENTRLGIPADFTDEGIRGVEACGTTAFPTQLALGNTWDKQLIYQIGRVTATEGRDMGYTNVYAPILDVVRDQRWGRIEESYGEDPYLVGRLGVEMVRGMQKDHTVVSTAKHFALYSANFGAREGMARTDPQIPLREADQLLVAPFRAAVKEAGIMGVMASYNDYDGVPIIGSKEWLTTRLREEYGFNGYVVSDSDALEYLFTKHHVAKDAEDAVALAVNAGLNVRTNFTKPETMILPLRQAVKDGKISMETLDKRVADVLRVKFTFGLFDKPYIEDHRESEKVVNDTEHKKMALRASQECIVLLKNDSDALPLNKSAIKSIAVIGPNANDESYCRQHYGPNGIKGVTVLQGIIDKVGAGVKVSYAKGCEIADSNWPESEVLLPKPSHAEEAVMDSAVAVAQQSDVVVMVMGGSVKTAGENKSRTDLNFTGYQSEMIKRVHATGKKVILVLIGAHPVTCNWEVKNIPGILEAWYPGQFGGTAIADVLFGDYNPGGKLSITIPRSVGQLPMNFPSKPSAQTDFGDDARLKGSLFPFGFGLSYTKFTYSSLQLSKSVMPAGDSLMVSCDVTNSGQRAGEEVVQLYLRQEVSSVTTWEKRLVGFERISLMPGETKRISFPIARSEMEILNAGMQYVVEPGMFTFMVGASSQDIRLKAQVEVK